MADWVDGYLWGDGFYEEGRAHYPPPPFESIERWAKCAKCGRAIPPDEYVDCDGLDFHERCLSLNVHILHPEEKG